MGNNDWLGDGLSIEKISETMKKYNMLPPGAAVLAAVSGGCDSSAMLHILSFLSTELGFHLEVAHVNHNLRGAESERDCEFVRSMCREYGITLHILSLDVKGYALEHGLSTEEAGRNVRYDFFAKTAAALGPDARIATAHSLSDSVETFLFNMARGTTLSGICGIPPVRGNIIRPLCETTRGELESFCGEHGIAYVTDSTNKSDDYARNRLRHNAVPALFEVNPAFERSFGRLTRSLREDRDYLAEQTSRALAEARLEHGVYDADAIAALPPAIRGRATAAILDGFGFSYDYERITAIIEMLGVDSFKWELARDRYLEQRGGKLFASVKFIPPKLPETPLKLGECHVTPQKAAICTVISGWELKNLKIVHHSLLNKMVDYDKIKGTAIFRPRREGDTIDISGVTKTLKKLFSQKKLPLSDRWSRMVLADESGVIWLEGFGPNRLAAADEQTTHALKIEITENTENNENNDENDLTEDAAR